MYAKLFLLLASSNFLWLPLSFSNISLFQGIRVIISFADILSLFFFFVPLLLWFVILIDFLLCCFLPLSFYFFFSFFWSFRFDQFLLFLPLCKQCQQHNISTSLTCRYRICSSSSFSLYHLACDWFGISELWLLQAIPKVRSSASICDIWQLVYLM